MKVLNHFYESSKDRLLGVTLYFWESIFNEINIFHVASQFVTTNNVK